MGTGAPRFVLSFDVQTANAWFGQMVVVTKGGIAARDRVKAQFETYLKKTFPGTDTFVKLLEVGPPVGRPVQYRLSGPDIAKVREFSQSLAGIVRANPHLDHVVFDWMEPARVVKVDVLQDKARQLGVSSEDIATTLNGVLSRLFGHAGARQHLPGECDGPRDRTGARIDRYAARPAIDRLGWPIGSARRRGHAALRNRAADNLAAITNPYDNAQGKHPRYRAAEDRRGSARAEGATSSQKDLPAGYSVTIGGSVEESAKSQAPIAAVVPLMLFIMATILMIQLQSFHRLFLVFAVAPLALIGVVMALLPSGAPLGFVAILGVLALIGILIRNSVILIVQIEQLKEEGRPAWDAVVEATEHRMRPIMLTAAAASLALIPIAREIFWGPMAYAMMGGIIVGTVLTLLFLPALYVAWFRIKEPAPATENTHENPLAPEMQAVSSTDASPRRVLENA